MRNEPAAARPMLFDEAFDHTGRKLHTLEHCALHRRTLRLSCPICNHERVLDTIALWWLFVRRGWPDELSGVASRLCCDPCRAAGRTVRPTCTVTREEPVGPQPPYPDRHEWKRVVSRYRS